MKKLSFYLSLLKFSISHPKKGFELINEVNQVRENINNEFEENKLKPLKNLEVLDLIFGKQENDNQNISKINDLKKILEKFFENISAEYPSKEKPYPIDYSIMGDSGPFLYRLCRIIKPDLIIETGVAYGVSSSYILKALHDNNNGKLISIDTNFRPWQSEEMIGAAIPKNLRDRWELKIGSSADVLEKVLENNLPVDIFLHDSLHTYKNMYYEFEKAWPHIKKEGFLLSDDITSNNALNDFCKKIKKEPIVMIQNKEPASYLGIIRK